MNQSLTEVEAGVAATEERLAPSEEIVASSACRPISRKICRMRLKHTNSTKAGDSLKMLNSYFQTDGSQLHMQSTLLHPIFASFAKKYKLTPRESQVMRILVLEGLRNDEIAAQMHISPKTLKNHLACMMKKTKTGSSRSLQALFFNFAMRMLLPSA
jgi:DNA-binding NarL/FixJ family response regulator